MTSRSKFLLPLLIYLPVLLTGCKPEVPVTVELVPKDQSGIDWMRDLRAGPSSASSSGSAKGSSTVAEPARMVVAIFQRSEAAWFFKVTGSPEKVAATQQAWQPFFNSINFESDSGDERPVWDLPDGWSLGGKAQMVFAILKLPDTDIEIRISRLGGQQDLLSNVNRWRGQLALPPATADSLDENLMLKQGDVEYRLFDQQGSSSGQSMGGPFMRRQALLQAQQAEATDQPKNAIRGDASAEQTAIKPPEKLQNDLAANPKFTLDPPQGYSPGKTSAMVVARFVKETDDGKVQISVVPLTATNQWNDNVNFWRQSVGMAAAGEEEIDAATEIISVSGIDGKKISLIASDESAEKSLVGVMVKHAGAAWFFKMMGESAMVKSDLKTFDAFLKSFKFTDMP